MRVALHLEPGDELVYLIEDGRVTLAKVTPDAAEDPFRTFHEWNSAADRRAYAKL